MHMVPGSKFGVADGYCARHKVRSAALRSQTHMHMVPGSKFDCRRVKTIFGIQFAGWVVYFAPVV